MATDSRPLGTGRLLEREAALAAVGDVVTRAQAGAGGMAIVEGAAGMGKSRLLAEAVQATGARALWARGEEIARAMPWGLARRLLGPAVRAGRGGGRSLLGGPAAPAAPLFDRSLPAMGGADAVLSIAYALLWVIAGLADGGPLVLAVDDVHWADLPSLQLLAYLLGRLDALPVAVLLARRPREPATDRRPLEALAADARVPRVTLRPLSQAGVDAIVDDALGDRAAADLSPACAAMTGGNPFYLHELLLELAQRPEPTLDAGLLRDVAPASVARTVFLRLARLGAGATSFARAVAVLGQGAAFPHARALADLDLPAAVAAFDALADAEILEPAEPLGFVHPLVAQAIGADIAPGERGELHRRAALLLDRDGAEPETLAAHLTQAGCRGDRWVVDTLRRAATRAAAQGATDAAAGWLARALAEPPSREQRPGLLGELGRAEAALGRPTAIAHLEQAAEATAAAEPRARLWADLGRALTLQGRMEQAAAAFRRGLDELDDPACDLGKELRAAWWSVAALEPTLRADVRGTPDPVLPDPDEHLTPGERELLAQQAIQRAFEGRGRGEVVALAERAWDGGALLRTTSGDGLTWTLVTGALLVADEVERNLEICDAALADARHRGSPMAYANACYCRAWPLLARGQVDASVADAQAALDAHGDGWSALLGGAAAIHACGLVERGEPEAAHRTLALVQDHPAVRSSMQYPVVLAARGRVLMAEHRAAEALECLLEAGAQLTAGGVTCPSAIPWQADAALAAGLAGERERAHELAVEALALARRSGAPTAIARALRAAARLERGERAVAAHREVLRVLDGLPPRLERICALVDLGGALRRVRRRADARAVLREALALAQEGGALALAETARVELAAAGARSGAAHRDGVAALTPSERRVAAMAAGGMTNRAIAQALFVTVKAVEYHLANTYRKLDIKRRAELAPLLGEHDGA